MAHLSLARAAADPAVAPRTALIAGGTVHTFADLAARAAPIRAALAGEGVGEGSRVALSARNSVGSPWAARARTFP